jgi:hypothetical protein
MSPAKLRHFLDKGPVLDLITDSTLAAKGDEMVSPTITKVMNSHLDSERAEEQDIGRSHHASVAAGGGEAGWAGSGPAPDREAKTGLPLAWSVSQDPLVRCRRGAHTADHRPDLRCLPPPTPKQEKRPGEKDRANQLRVRHGQRLPRTGRLATATRRARAYR